MRRTRSPLRLLAIAVAGLTAAAILAAGASGNGVGNETYVVHNLVSDSAAIPADRHDPNLVNAWGITAGPATPWWVADNGTDKSTLYNGAGVPVSLVVGVDGGPTGTVFNGTSDFVVSANGKRATARFLFASEDGGIRGWNPGVSPNAVVGTMTPDAVYKGLAIGSSGGSNFLYATNFHAGRVDVFDGSFGLVHMLGAFVDPQLPAGFAPFGIQLRQRPDQRLRAAGERAVRAPRRAARRRAQADHDRRSVGDRLRQRCCVRTDDDALLRRRPERRGRRSVRKHRGALRGARARRSSRRARRLSRRRRGRSGAPSTAASGARRRAARPAGA